MTSSSGLTCSCPEVPTSGLSCPFAFLFLPPSVADLSFFFRCGAGCASVPTFVLGIPLDSNHSFEPYHCRSWWFFFTGSLVSISRPTRLVSYVLPKHTSVHLMLLLSLGPGHAMNWTCWPSHPVGSITPPLGLKDIALSSPLQPRQRHRFPQYTNL